MHLSFLHHTIWTASFSKQLEHCCLKNDSIGVHSNCSQTLFSTDLSIFCHELDHNDTKCGNFQFSRSFKIIPHLPQFSLDIRSFLSSSIIYSPYVSSPWWSTLWSLQSITPPLVRVRRWCQQANYRRIKTGRPSHFSYWSLLSEDYKVIEIQPQL